MTLRRKRQIFIAIIFLAVPILGFLITKLASGYRPDFSQKTLKPTGLLVATSTPNGAQLWLNNKLKSATDTTLSLSPAEYEVEIKKEGYTSWKKTLKIKKEVVTETDAYLFSTYPNLKALTFTGASRPLLSPDRQKVVFLAITASTSKNGLWMLDLSDRLLGFSREPRQILENPAAGRDFSESDYQWSPDSKQILVSLKKENFLLEIDRLNQNISLTDITPTLDLLFDRWQKEEELRNQAQISKLPEKLLEIIDQKVAKIDFAPDESKIIYTATASASLPEKISSSLPAANTQKEEREIKPNRIYVYDLKEDRNFYLTEAKPEKNLGWFPTSKHIFWIQKDKVSLWEYDGTNLVDIYTGPFENSFAFPFPSGDRILILTSIGKNTPANLYSVTLH